MYRNPYAKLRPPLNKPYTEIYLIRHCHPNYKLEKTYGEEGMPLSEAGLIQRRFLTRRLLKMDINRVYISGLARAQETAAEYVKKAKKVATIDSRLNEINWTSWYRIKYFNMSEASRRKRLKSRRRLDKQLDKMQTEARRALADIFHENRNKTIAIFSHGNFIKALLTGIMNADVIGFLSLEIFQSSVSKLVIDCDGYIKISYINDASHLPKPPIEDLFITLAD